MKGAALYMFEPLVPPRACVESTKARTAEQESEAPRDHRGVRLQSTPSPDVAVEDWCQCDHCQRQEKPGECQCCQEIRQTRGMATEESTQCITEYEGFSEVCLARHALRAVYNRYHQCYRKSIPDEGNKKDSHKEKKRRSNDAYKGAGALFLALFLTFSTRSATVANRRVT
ncbi:hypothetical protein CAPTEDRAFT_190844 [Capitella teleta]|uniref:P2X purinoreceptor 7 intracellular domain-containing protein n=1 Tax=Capitella teleta TaxID=283909 RepID=R7U644_CAPTE|nr:hypothetical protein CAPTEDRAFT_190844 [Capitella teleta]|eukprot:ELT98630.1 hypothetical protein CAPTEDRAFT_190844 [Capitella teleta]